MWKTSIRRYFGFTVALSVAAGCGNGNSNNNNNGGDGQTPVVSTSGNTTTITGSKSGNVQVHFDKAGYSFVVKSATGHVYMTINDLPYPDSTDPDSGAGGQYTQTFVYQISDAIGGAAGDHTAAVTADGQFAITFTKLPTGIPVAPPQSSSGAGTQVVGPISLQAGAATVNVACPDAHQAGFSVSLRDGNTGARAVPMFAANVGGGTAQNNYSAQKQITVPAAGTYYFEIGANQGANWSLNVSQ